MMHQTNCTKNSQTKKTKYRPLALFANGSDLPLFTSSPDVVVADPVPAGNKTEPGYIQMSIFDSGVTQ